MIRAIGIGLLSFCLAAALGAGVSVAVEPCKTEFAASAQPVLNLEKAVQWALARNPELAAIRAQHGIAAGALITAETYPFNPILESKLRGASAPQDVEITNHLNQEHWLALELEVRGQGKHRRNSAAAGLSRTDWEIAFQETSLAVRVVRAFDTLIYRYEKLRLVEETLELNKKGVEQVSKLMLPAADLIVAQTEVEDVRGQLGPARTAVAVAWGDLRRLLGLVDEVPEIRGSLTVPDVPVDVSAWTQKALVMRPDFQARHAAVAEAEARLRLQVADRFGNVVAGPSYEIDTSKISLIGVQATVPLPVLNTRKGEIYQREAERTRALLEERQTEVQIQEDVNAAIARLDAARKSTESYRGQILPALRTSQDRIEKLFVQQEPGLDVLRVIDVRRKLLKARDSYLDALFELRQAAADLAAAVGDVTLSYGPP